MVGFSGSRQWVYAKKVGGRFQRLHRVSGVALIAFLFAVPWFTFGGLPAVRIDLPARRLYLLGTVFTSSEGFNLVLLALLAAFSLFFFTALLGRLWCGYVCPQTVFLEEWIRPLENWIEGDRAVRMRRDAGPWTGERVARKAAKFTVFAALAGLVGMAVMSWFTGPRELWTGQAGSVSYALVGIVAGGLFLDWAWFREQLCIYVCPYARFQGALTDDHSLVISYDEARGEPRGKGKAAAVEGHCIDCKKCVDVCPQGIDIRNGFQLECISCARCIDACEDVMPKLGHPTLVRYSTIAVDQGGKTHLLRRRTVVYAALLTGLLAVLGLRIAGHSALEVTVNRAPGSLFVVEDDGSVRNTFLVHVMNNDPVADHLFVLSVEGLDGVQMAAQPVQLASMQDKIVPLMVKMPPGSVDRTTEFTVRVFAAGDDDLAIRKNATFKAPPRAGGEG